MLFFSGSCRGKCSTNWCVRGFLFPCSSISAPAFFDGLFPVIVVFAPVFNLSSCPRTFLLATRKSAPFCASIMLCLSFKKSLSLRSIVCLLPGTCRAVVTDSNVPTNVSPSPAVSTNPPFSLPRFLSSLLSNYDLPHLYATVVTELCFSDIGTCAFRCVCVCVRACVRVMW
eukprot:RCo052195